VWLGIVQKDWVVIFTFQLSRKIAGTLLDTDRCYAKVKMWLFICYKVWYLIK